MNNRFLKNRENWKLNGGGGELDIKATETSLRNFLVDRKINLNGDDPFYLACSLPHKDFEELFKLPWSNAQEKFLRKKIGESSNWE